MQELNSLFYVLFITYFPIFGVCTIFSEEQCRNGRKLCDNGQCISIDNWCDGKIDCTDRSDETTSCLEVKCSKFLFRCSYGACIKANLKCNGVNDCYDGSDETPIVCSGLQLNSTCSGSSIQSNNIFEVQCNNSQCILQENVCDGKVDCTDGSDETIETCANQVCPVYYFRCTYGACISKLAKCDNKIDCADRSDENNDKCREDRSIVPEVSNGCYVPSGSLVLMNSNTNETFKPGILVPLSTSVNYSCPPKHILDGSINNFCDGDWVNQHPKCIKTCPPIKHHTIQAYCNFKGEGIDCNRYMEPGTTAKINCAVMYKKPSGPVHEDLHCETNGAWNYSPFQCIQICGTIDTKKALSNSNRKLTAPLKVPWHVGIYSKQRNDKYQQICGGTLYSSKIVISAAHCFWDEEHLKLHNESKFLVVAGKAYRDYNAYESLDIQKSHVSEIHFHVAFRGVSNNYADDIAVLALTDHIIFKNHIRPACLKWKWKKQRALESNKSGIVAAWGFTHDGKYNPELRSIELISIDLLTCKNDKIPRNDTISDEKFCVETMDNNVCPGDSGGGYVIPEEEGNTTYYHIWGVISTKIRDTTNDIFECNGHSIRTLTNVQYYRQLINDAYNDTSV